MPAPSKAKGTSLAAPHRPAHYIRPSPVQRRVEACDFCNGPCDQDKITIKWEHDEGVDEAVFCSTECLVSHSGEELFGDFEEDRVRTEVKKIVSAACPACKARIREL